MRSLFALPAQLAALLFAATSSHAFTFQRAQPADLDISQLGRIGVAGDFDAVSLYEWIGQSQQSLGSENGGSNLLSQYPNGAFANLNTTDGSIRTMCPFVHKDGRLAGVILGGNFTSIGGVAVSGVALFNVTSNEIQPLPGLSGSVNALHCDTERDTVYVGGSFTGGNSSNAISWVTGWTNLPFAGFNGPVNSITKAPNGNIIFGGSFDGLGNSSTPQVQDAQVVPVSSASIEGIASSTQAGFSDPRNIICKTGEQDGAGNTWLLADNAAGAWDATFRFGFNPTKLRLYNTDQQGRGTKTWRFTAQPLNGIMNFSYVDPSDGQKRYCDARCPLPEGNTTAQDFEFVNSVGMNKFRIDISDWYGSGAGLAGIVLFQDDVYSFAINDFNEAQCDGVSTGSAASTATGPWTVSPSHQSNSEYLTATFTGDVSSDAASVVFQPNIKQTGNYSLTIFTPGCIGDGTCGTRGRVNITGQIGSGSGTSPSQPISTEIWQTNNYDKYDEIYFGRIDAANGNFRPTITLSPASGQTGPLNVVAQKIRSNLRVSTGGLNGLYEYNPNNATVQNDLSSSVINTAGTDLPANAIISSLAANGDTVFVAGNFSGDQASIFSITSRVNDLGEGGLNGPVTAMTLNDSALFVAGDFKGTQNGPTTGLSGVGSYNISTSKWAPLGAGVNGIAQYVVPFTLNLTNDEPELCIAFSGSFDRINAFGDNQEVAAQGFAVWVPGRGNWLQNLNLDTITVQGVLTAGTQVPGNPPVYAGRVASFALGASGAFELTESGNTIAQFPASITQTQAQSQTSGNAKVKRAVVDETTNGVVAGLFYREDDYNLTIYGGHFTSTATNGSTITNLAVLDGSDNDSISGFASGIDSSSVIAALGATGNSLFAGGNLTGNVNGRAVSGIVVYDLQSKNYAGSQPASLQGGSGSSATVNAIAPQPSTDLVYVGGDFESAGSFNCPALCVYDVSRSQWVSPGGATLSGSVASMAWVSNEQLAIVGNLTAAGNTSTVVIYDSEEDSGRFTTIDGPTGTLTAITSASSDGSQYWVGGSNQDGSPLIAKYNGTWTTLEPALEDGSVIQGLQVFSTSRDHARSNLLERNHVLMVLGSLNLPTYGNASAAIFNGTAWTPYSLTGGSGSSTSLRNVFVENPANFFRSGRNYLALGFVVLIGLAIALGIIFLLVLAGIFVERYRRKRDGYVRAPQTIPQDKFNNVDRIPPEHLFGSMNPNTRPVL